MNPFNPSHIANDNGRRKSIVKLLDDLLQDTQGEYITIGQLIDTLGTRGYGLLILILDLPNLIPLPLPGLSTIFGVPMALIGLQMLLGIRRPWVPKKIGERKIARDNFIKMFAKARPILEKIERVLRPRLAFLSGNWTRHAIGLAILIMAGVMALPIPLGNFVLAVPIGLIALGMIERDGLFVIAGLFGGAFALGFNLAIVMLGIEGVLRVFS